MTLRTRLYIAASVLLLVVMLLGVLLIQSVEHSEFEQIDQQLRTALPVVGAVNRHPSTPLVVPSKGSRPPTSDNDLVSQFYVAIVTSHSRQVLFTPLSGKGSLPQLPKFTSRAGQPVRIATVGSLSGTDRWRALLIQPHGQPQRLLVAESLIPVDATVHRLRLGVIGAGLVVLGVLVAAGFWIGRLGLRPIAEVTDVADAISAGERSRRVRGTSGRTEAAHLARAMNVMLDEQQALEARLRQFVADASHELRTPVSVILGITDLWRQGQLESGSAGQDAMRRIGQAGRQMGGLVEDLLLLARLDDGGKSDDSPVDLVSLVNEVVHDAGATDPSRNIVVQGNAAVVVAGDARALRQAISNLVTNSLRHTPPDSSITIDVRATGSSGRLVVRDEGPGMTPEEANKAFDRFWRADSSRSRSGTGLGLSIVSGIVAGHKGDVTLRSDPDIGTTVTIQLPLHLDHPASMQSQSPDLNGSTPGGGSSFADLT